MLLIVSRNEDFCDVLAEQAKRELVLASEIITTSEEAKALAAKAELIVSDGPLAGEWPVPVVEVGHRPIRLGKLLSDIRACLEKGKEDALTLGEYRFSPQRKTVMSKKGKNAALTDKETQLLVLLAKAGKKGTTRDALLTEVWGAASTEMETHTLETHIYRLRAKLQEIGCHEAIAATQGGYKLAI